jgi:hypothetical protein
VNPRAEALTFKLSAVLTLVRHFPISPEREENAAKATRMVRPTAIFQSM